MPRFGSLSHSTADSIITVCAHAPISELRDVTDVNKELGRPEIECDKLKGIFAISPSIYT